MKKTKKIFLLSAAVIITLSCLALYSTAFDANDYGSDFGGGGGGGSDFGGGIGIGSTSNSGGSGDGGDLSPGTMVIIGVVVVIAVIVYFIKHNKGDSGKAAGGVKPASYQGLNITLPDRTAQIEEIIKQNDPNFSAGDFTSFAKNVYMDIQNAWCKRDMSPVRPVLHDNLYSTTVRQLQAKIDQGVIYHYESIVVNTAYLTSYAKDAQFEYLTIYLNARMVDWQEDEKTGKILRGDKFTRWDLRYKMKFMRSAGIVTKDEVAAAKGHNCPNCGAPLEISSSGTCEYCNSVVTTGQYSWVLSDFGTIRNDTVDEGIKGV